MLFVEGIRERKRERERKMEKALYFNGEKMMQFSRKSPLTLYVLSFTLSIGSELSGKVDSFPKELWPYRSSNQLPLVS